MTLNKVVCRNFKRSIVSYTFSHKSTKDFRQNFERSFGAWNYTLRLFFHANAQRSFSASKQITWSKLMLSIRNGSYILETFTLKRLPRGKMWYGNNKITVPNIFIDYRVLFCRAASVSASSVQEPLAFSIMWFVLMLKSSISMKMQPKATFHLTLATFANTVCPCLIFGLRSKLLPRKILFEIYGTRNIYYNI